MEAMAVIDLGTNTFHLQVATVNNGNIETLSRLQIPVKLGEGGINKGYIAEAAYQRGINALKEFAAELKKFTITQTKALATSAIRDASNGLLFMQQVKEITGIAVQTITGDEEATFICEGVRHSLLFTSDKYLVMDIGGGSVEFIIADKYTIFWKHSFRLGAARLIEKFHQHDPMGEEERAALYIYLQSELAHLWRALEKYPAKVLVGSAGSFESVVELIDDVLGKQVESFSNHSQLIPLADYDKIHQVLLHSTTAQRKTMKGLVSFRVEMMVAASCLMDVVLKQSGIQTLIASEYSLKEGILFSMK